LLTCYNRHVRLIVSLPRNDAALAAVAADSGADMLKVHLNVTHRASGTEFGSWQAELERIQAILDSVQIPVGVMPGSEVVASQADWGEMVFAGIEFFDIYVQHMPVWMWELPIRKIPAISEIYPANILFGLVRGLKNSNVFRKRTGSSAQNEVLTMPSSPTADFLEASIVKPEDYGKPLNALDLANYRWVADCVDIPVIIPTQKRIEIQDLPMLFGVGVGGIMIGKIVTGDTPEELGASVADFRQAIDRLN
jgi:hypothetical protein